MAEDTTIAQPPDAHGGAALAEMTAEVVAVYVAHNHVQPGDVPGLIISVHAALGGLGQVQEPEATAEPLKSPVPIRKTITDEHIISLEDGRPYKALKRHLAKRGLTPDAYRQKWGLPHDYPMIAPAYARARSELARTIGLGTLRRKR